MNRKSPNVSNAYDRTHTVRSAMASRSEREVVVHREKHGDEKRRVHIRVEHGDGGTRSLVRCVHFHHPEAPNIYTHASVGSTMSVVGVDYAAWKPRMPSPSSQAPAVVDEGEEPIEAFDIIRLGQDEDEDEDEDEGDIDDMHVLYDCDDGDWFAIMDELGALVTRPRAPMQPGRCPLVAVNYGPPLRHPYYGTPYFGGALDMGSNVHCIATRSEDEVRLLELRPDPAPLRWCVVDVAGGPDLCATCKCLLGGDTIIGCDYDACIVSIFKRTLNKREDGTWHLSGREEIGRFPTEPIAAHSAFTQVCAVSNNQTMRVFIVSDEDDYKKRFLYRVDIPRDHPPDAHLDRRVLYAGLADGSMVIMQSRNDVYMCAERHLEDGHVETPHDSHTYKSYSVKGLTNRLTYSDRRDIDMFTPYGGRMGAFEPPRRWTEVTIPGYGILTSECKLDPRDGDGPQRGHCELLMVSKVHARAVVARSETMVISHTAQPMLTTCNLKEVGFVWMDCIVNVQVAADGNGYRVRFARCFRGDVDSVHPNPRPQWTRIRMRPVRNKAGGALTLKRTPSKRVDTRS